MKIQRLLLPALKNKNNKNDEHLAFADGKMRSASTSGEVAGSRAALFL
jgi:hypothetical protein